MLLVEFDTNLRLVKLIAAADQLDSALEQGEITSNWDVDTLLSYFRKFDIILSPEDLYNMIQVKPLKNVISNIEGDEVIFKGLPKRKKTNIEPSSEKSKDVVSKMAKKAMK